MKFVKSDPLMQFYFFFLLPYLT